MYENFMTRVNNYRKRYYVVFQLRGIALQCVINYCFNCAQVILKFSSCALTIFPQLE